MRSDLAAARPRRAALWAAFVTVHAVVAVLGWLLPNQPMGDVHLVYEPWSEAALQGDRIVGVTEPWVYPILALAPMLATQALGFLGPYEVGWALLVTACDALAFALLVGGGRSRGRVAAAWFWLAFALALGPVGMYRLDAVTAPLGVAGVLWLAGRPAVAGALLAAATWIKVWPAALLAVSVAALWGPARARATGLAVGAAVLSAVVIGVVALAGGLPHLLGFVATQQGRGLQIEAPAATPFVWGAVAGREGWFLFYDRAILTFQVAGPGADVVAAATTPALALAAIAIAALAAAKTSRGAAVSRVLPPAALALVLALIVANRVGSPQFHAWLIAPLVLWLVWDRRRAWPLAGLALVCAGLTQLVYPIAYWSLLRAEPLGAALLTARNLALVALLAWSVVRLVRVPSAHARALAASDTRAERA
ncbi:hypothetical protein [Microbacterium sp. Marseille-Q6965]|uniref:hypothetical protein n=1 Tax=Microbacterium sp. Marseille-Q6965 TaxID=2965072 RepID=UPI0021B708F6|nr:hypothetical protein [Microbacterium sp. Marseille-Q6965]